jgi:hypothetical protein
MPPAKRKSVPNQSSAIAAAAAKRATRAASDPSLDHGGASSGAHSRANDLDFDGDAEPQPNAPVEMESSARNGGAAGCSSDELQPRAFQVGRDKTVIGVVKDPVGLVGCVVMVPWPSKASRCVVDAYASDAPDGAAYIISWVSKRDEHHLLPVARMASLGAQCAADVKSKLEGARMPLAADGTLG